MSVWNEMKAAWKEFFDAAAEGKAKHHASDVGPTVHQPANPEPKEKAEKK